LKEAVDSRNEQTLIHELPAAVALRAADPAANAAIGHFVEGPADHNVKIRRQFANLRLANGLEVHKNRFQRQRIAHAAHYHVAVVLTMSVDEDLRRQQSAAVAADGDVDMWGAAGIGNGLDRAKVILALGIGQKAAIALKIFVVAARA